MENKILKNHLGVEARKRQACQAEETNEDYEMFGKKIHNSSVSGRNVCLKKCDVCEASWGDLEGHAGAYTLLSRQ